VTREPGGTPGAEAIRALLMTGPDDRWDARAEAMLFAAARADHVARVIQPALARGDWVVCDRFVDSTRAYQGAAGGISDDDILALHGLGSAALMPDRTLILQLPLDEASARANRRDGTESDRFDRRSADYHARLAAFFKLLATREAMRCRLIDAQGSEESVSGRLLAAVEDLL
jgi:dTMP kinase